MNCAEKFYAWEKYDKTIDRMLFDIADSLHPRGYYDEKYQYHEISRPTDEEDEYLKELAELLRNGPLLHESASARSEGALARNLREKT